MIKRRIWLAVVILTVIAAIIALTTVFTGIGTKKQAGFCADLPDSIGLYSGNPVTQMGYRVGTVGSIKPAGDHVRVSFELTGDRRYPADVKAVTRSKTLLTDRTLELVGNYDGGPRLTAGSCISLANSMTPKSLSAITGSAADFIDAVSPVQTDSITTAIAGLTDSLRGKGTSVNDLMLTASRAMANPDHLVSDIGSIINDFAPLSATTLDNWSTLKQTLGVLPEDLAVGAHGLWDGVTAFIGGIGPLLADLYDVQTNYGDDINTMLGYVSVGLHMAASQSGEIKNLLSGIPMVTTAIRRGASAPSIQVRPPQVQVRSPEPAALCASLNRVSPHSCAVAGGNARIADLGVLDWVLAGQK
ncbi:MlaD family protein [Jongsikchunia kroppenstedtii]|uniref:MlaD family protein n=1 Tax=Jongsikchunia kroppenstedtii TaxID=1121721 RepID=UPI00037A35DB|nr:MlaD family protein [Jongsikchunia kroppenstedtii]